ncbi:DNA-binding response OmpR family regulator [Amycolatopsis bartoniae]|uniref:Sensory transduction protein RegX3 n=1 Tax=Amycolatopsis bartoniae TaxID=941986 RepID=A0A8H9MAY4_9PSEU|nr:response regulator transcription factor [Amycolatopsis bartoniae]MBB2935661.1 DNA-binding response OmpR family regulator [Amycolatopsis bartoniae]TVT02326.1 response regulator transcription factor [Amycolatopsis bartoniae]GHF60929.1 DNA-binding response regulator [Amycolatopsis bartoniae]
MRFLLVEDDGRVATAVRSALHRRGVEVEWAATGLEAKAKYSHADVVLLDLGLPDLDGIELCELIRRGSDAAIIVVSARGQVDDRIAGLRAGADDYLVKPFHVDELLARVQAVLRRRTAPAPERPRTILVEDVRIDPARFEVSAGGEAVALSRKEFQLLYKVAVAAGDVCTRQSLIADIWGEPWPGANRTLDVHVATLRTKLDRPGLIETVRGVGYRLGGRLREE